MGYNTDYIDELRTTNEELNKYIEVLKRYNDDLKKEIKGLETHVNYLHKIYNSKLDKK